MDFEILKTKKELDNLILDVKRFATCFRFIALAVYILFLVYNLVVGNGYLALNIFLLVLTVAYTAFAAVCSIREAKGKTVSKADKVANRVYHWAKFAATCLSALLSVAGILTAVERATPISILLAVLLPVCLALQLIFDLVIVWVTVRVSRFKVAISQDLEALKKDLGKIALGFVKDALFSRKKKEEEEMGEAIIVGSDSIESLKAMKSVEDGEKGTIKSRAGNFFQKLFGGKKNKKTPAPLVEDGEIQTESK